MPGGGGYLRQCSCESVIECKKKEIVLMVITKKPMIMMFCHVKIFLVRKSILITKNLANHCNKHKKKTFTSFLLFFFNNY